MRRRLKKLVVQFDRLESRDVPSSLTGGPTGLETNPGNPQVDVEKNQVGAFSSDSIHNGFAVREEARAGARGDIVQGYLANTGLGRDG
jgi:hypothetical protein